ncbi:MAG TPA: hypothetical protein VE781_13700 [Kineosporiaceae bacterium]|jgi:hypothetical protein|nr:hypothetical protein [Kineosporiaceae bacterium]
MTFAEDMRDWREVEDTLVCLGRSLGFFLDVEDREAWSALQYANPLCDALSDVLFRLRDIGALDERDGPGDVEFRWSDAGAATKGPITRPRGSGMSTHLDGQR